MNKKIVYSACVFLCACASDPNEQTPSTIEDGEIPALRLAERLRQEGNHSSALNFYEKAMAKDPENNDIKLSYAMSLRGNGSLGDARRVLLDLYKKDPSNRNVRIELARVYIEENKPQDALTYLEPIIRQNKQTDAAMLEGVALDLLSEHEKAQEIYRDILTKEPHNLRVQSNLALSLAISGKSPEAITILEDVHKSNRSTIRDRHNLAIAYEKAGQREKATRLWKMDLTAQEAEETQQFFDSLNGETAINTLAFEHATKAGNVQEVSLDLTHDKGTESSSNLAKFTQVHKPVPTPKPYKGASTTVKPEAAHKNPTDTTPSVQESKETHGEPLTHLNGPVMNEGL